MRICTRNFSSRFESGSSNRKTEGLRDGPPSRSPLALAAGKLARFALSTSSIELEYLRSLVHPRGISGSGVFRVAQAIGHVVVHARVRVERVILEQRHGDVAIHRFEIVDLALATMEIAPPVIVSEAGNHAQRRLAAQPEGPTNAEAAVGHGEGKRLSRALNPPGSNIAHCRAGRPPYYFSVSTRPLTNNFCIKDDDRDWGGSMASMAVAMASLPSVSASCTATIFDADDDRLHVVARGDEQRPEILVPAVDEENDEERREIGARQRQQHVLKAEGSGGVDLAASSNSSARS